MPGQESIYESCLTFRFDGFNFYWNNSRVSLAPSGGTEGEREMNLVSEGDVPQSAFPRFVGHVKTNFSMNCDVCLFLPKPEYFKRTQIDNKVEKTRRSNKHYAQD